MDSSETPVLTCTKRLPGGAQCQNARADQDPEATNRHCLEHRREQHRRHFLSTMDQQRGKGYSKGVEQMRAVLVREFAALGDSNFSGIEIAALIKQAPGPAREPEAEEEPEEKTLS